MGVMRLCAAAAVLVFFINVPVAESAMMAHFDLAGLELQSAAVVIADKIGPGTPGPAGEPRTRYKIVKVLRGAIADDPVEVWDSIYRTDGHFIDSRAVLFLAKQGKSWTLVPSGLRVVEHGGVFRFTQQSNPGP